MSHFEKLYQLVDTIVGPSGCMWSKSQTITTILPSLIEESYEVIDAVEEGDKVGMEEELGDLLFVAFFLIYLAKRDFAIEESDVIKGICAKLKRRHPHIFAGVKVESLDDIAKNWEKIKKEEKKHRKSVTEGIPKHLGSLPRANKLFDKLRNTPLPFFENRAKEFEHLSEEALAEQFLHLAYAAHKKGIDPEGALRRMTKEHLEQYPA